MGPIGDSGVLAPLTYNELPVADRDAVLDEEASYSSHREECHNKEPAKGHHAITIKPRMAQDLELSLVILPLKVRARQIIERWVTHTHLPLLP